MCYNNNYVRIVKQMFRQDPIKMQSQNRISVKVSEHTAQIQAVAIIRTQIVMNKNIDIHSNVKQSHKVGLVFC